MVKTCIYMSISCLFLLQRMSKKNYIPELFLFLFTNTSTCNQISRLKTSTEYTHQFFLSIMPLLIFKPKRSDFLSLIFFFYIFNDTFNNLRCLYYLESSNNLNGDLRVYMSWSNNFNQWNNENVFFFLFCHWSSVTLYRVYLQYTKVTQLN